MASFVGQNKKQTERCYSSYPISSSLLIMAPFLASKHTINRIKVMFIYIQSLSSAILISTRKYCFPLLFWSDHKTYKNSSVFTNGLLHLYHLKLCCFFFLIHPVLMNADFTKANRYYYVFWQKLFLWMNNTAGCTHLYTTKFQVKINKQLTYFTITINLKGKKNLRIILTIQKNERLYNTLYTKTQSLYIFELNYKNPQL